MAWLRPVPRTVGAATAYVFPAVSVTDVTFDVALFHPMITTLVSPAACAFGNVAPTAATGVCGVATDSCSYTGVAGVPGAVVVVVAGADVDVVELDAELLVVPGAVVVVGPVVVVVAAVVVVVGLVGAALNVASCITHAADCDRGAVAL